MQWSLWCKHPEYLFGDPALDFAGYRNFRAPILAYSFTDDSYVSSDHHRGVMGRYENADVTWRNLRPSDIGVKSIGHFGFFKEELRDTLWKETADWLGALR